MNKTITFVSLCALCASSVFAASAPQVKIRKIEPTGSAQEMFRQKRFQANIVAENPSRVADAADGAILWEDFQKFSEGSETSPTSDEVNDSQGLIPSQYTQMPGWGGAGVHQSGGSAYIGFIKSPYGEDTGFITTPPADLTENNGTYTVRFRAKSVLSMGDELLISNFNPNLSTPYISSATVEITNEWKEYTVEMNQGSASSCLQFYTLYGGWIFDDFSVVSEGVPAPSEFEVLSYKGTEMTVRWNAVEGAQSYVYNIFYPNEGIGDDLYFKKEATTDNNTLTVTGLDPDTRYSMNVAAVVDGTQSAYSQIFDIMPLLDTPETLRPTDYDGESFIVSWNPVEGAELYVLNVYSYIDGGTRDAVVVPFITDEQVTGTSFKVMGIDKNTIYYFTVQAKNGKGDISDTSLEVQVLPTLDAPVAKPASEITGDSFVASWELVENANVYEATTYKEHTASAAETFAVADANLGLYESSGSLYYPEALGTGLSLPRDSGAFYWYINRAALMDGGIGLDNTLAVFYGMAYLYSPMYDFTPFGGKATFEITLASANATKAVVALAETDDQLMLQEVESVEVPVTSSMTTRRVEFTKGSDNACILVYAKDGTYLMFKDLKLTVDMPEGSKIEFPYDQMVVENGNACRFEKVEYGKSDRISYSVVAAKVTQEAQILSEPSNRVYVDFNSSVESLGDAVAAPKAYVSGETLFVENPNAETVEVFDMTGACVLNDNTGAATVTATLASRGVYLVKVGSRVMKVMR